MRPVFEKLKDSDVVGKEDYWLPHNEDPNCILEPADDFVKLIVIGRIPEKLFGISVAAALHLLQEDQPQKIGSVWRLTVAQ